MRRRITYITECNGYGGAERYLICLVADLGRDADVSVVFPFKPCNAEVRHDLEQAGAKVVNLPQFKALYPLNLLIAWLFFLSHKADLFHFSLTYPDSCRWSLLAASLLGRRFFITEHLVPPDPFRAGAYFAITHLLFSPLKKLSYRAARKVAAVSAGNRDILVAKYGMPADKLTVIHNGVDCSVGDIAPETAARLKEELAVPEGSLVLATVGRLMPQKGHQYLISALQRLADEGYPLLLLLVGEGPLEESLKKQAEALGVGKLVRFTGFRTDVHDILSIADIFVLPSLNEGFPLILLEAMAAGKPIVATRVTGCTEAIVHRDTGLLCEPESSEELSREILSLLRDPAGRAAMGQRARQVSLERFDQRVMLDKTRRLYQEGAEGGA